VFERDSIKYETYGAAVEAALRDRVPEAEAGARASVLMVVGAGRGPLVRASIQVGGLEGGGGRCTALGVGEGWGIGFARRFQTPPL
jgi:hypothetical protein